MEIPTVVEIHKYSLPETNIVDTRIQSRLCFCDDQVPTAIQIQTTQIVPIDIPEFESVDGIIVKRTNCLKCKNVPIGPILISLMVFGFLCLVLMDHIRMIVK
jgi:hypothetical protein